MLFGLASDSRTVRVEEGPVRPRAAKEQQKRGRRVAIRDYRCPEMLINLVLTLGLLLVIKQP